MYQKFKDKKFWTDGWGSVFLAILAALTIRWAFLEAYVIPSGSMLPSLLINDHIFVNKMVYGVRAPFSRLWLVNFQSPKRGEVVIFRNPEDPDIFYIKRLVGLPGDTIFYEKGILYVNNKAVPKSAPSGEVKENFKWLQPQEKWKDNYEFWEEKLDEHAYSVLLKKTAFRSDYGPVTVPEGHYFVMGDNRDNSRDSRRISFISHNLLLGRGANIWLSCEEKLSFLPFLCNPLTIRWSRFFKSIN